MKKNSRLGLLTAAFVTIPSALHAESPAEIEKIVARLDTEYQAAVKATMRKPWIPSWPTTSC